MKDIVCTFLPCSVNKIIEQTIAKCIQRLGPVKCYQTRLTSDLGLDKLVRYVIEGQVYSLLIKQAIKICLDDSYIL